MYYRRNIKSVIAGLILLLFSLPACTSDMPPAMRLVAGRGAAGFEDGHPAAFNKPIRLAPYTEDAVLVADIYNHAIRIVTLDGDVTTLVGGPTKAGYADGPVSEAKLLSPHGVAYEEQNRAVYIAEAGNHTIRRVHLSEDGAHQVSTLAGVAATSGFRDGKADSALFNSPHGLVLGAEGEIIVADIGNTRIREIRDGQVTTLTGSDKTGNQDGPLEQATFTYPMDVIRDGANLLLADAGTHQIRKIAIGQAVTTIALQDTLSTPHGIAVDANKNIYIADMGTHRILKIDQKGNVQSIAGTGQMGTGVESLNKPAALLVHAGILWIADLNNHQIKVLEIY